MTSTRRGVSRLVTLVALIGALATSAVAGGSTPAGAAPGEGKAAAGHVVVPLAVRQVGPLTRATLTLRVGRGHPFRVLLDTGSAGLRLLPGVAGPQTVPTDRTTTSTFGSGAGVQITGRIAHAPVTIAGVTTDPIDVELLDTACRPHGGCAPASSLHGLLSGTQGILGIGLANGPVPATPVYSPLLQLPAPYSAGFTLRLGPGGAGSLTLGAVSPAGVALPLQPATPDRYPNGARAFQKDVRLCWTVAGNHACGDTDLDIGAPSAIVTPAAIPGLTPDSAGYLARGTTASITTPGGTPLWQFTSAGHRATSAIVYAALPGGYTAFNTGIGFALSHTLAFDLADGTVSVSPS